MGTIFVSSLLIVKVVGGGESLMLIEELRVDTVYAFRIAAKTDKLGPYSPQITRRTDKLGKLQNIPSFEMFLVALLAE